MNGSLGWRTNSGSLAKFTAIRRAAEQLGLKLSFTSQPDMGLGSGD